MTPELHETKIRPGWNQRIPTLEQRQRFKNITSIHAMTRAWLKEVSPEKQTHSLSRLEAPGIQENLWMLEGLSENHAPSDLDSLMDDSTPDELLDRLEKTIWTVQTWTLSGLLDKTPAAERTPLLNVLAQSSWKSGRECALQRWARFPDQERDQLRALLAALMDSPIAGRSPSKSILIKRITPLHCEFQLLTCPHSSPFAETRSRENELCELQSHWVRGYLYALNTKVRVDYRPRTDSHLCEHHWRLQD